jgi:ankyrin repeat protein
LKAAEPVAEASQPEPPTAKAPDISIHDAALENLIEVIKQHLAAGTDVNAMDDHGWAPLHYAIENDRNELVELLITNGADVNLKLEGSIAPLDFAIDFKRPEIADLLRKHGGKTGKELKAEGK